MIAPPPLPAGSLVITRCAWCQCFPCECARTCQCACGGMLIELTDIADAVRIHQRTPDHQAWRERMGL